MNQFILGLTVLVALVGFSVSKNVRGCYYTNWSQYHPGIWKFMPENIDPSLCSHVFFAFSAMNDKFQLDKVEPNDEELYGRVNSLKKKQPELRTILSFGGGVFVQNNDALLKRMLSDAKNRKTFIDSIIQYVRRIKYDGFDFNWFPEAGIRDTFALLIKEFRAAIELESKSSQRPRLLLFLGVPAIISKIDAGYNFDVLIKTVDYFNVFTMDYHGTWDKVTGFNAPQYDRNHDNLSVNSTMFYLKDDKNVPGSQLIVGLPSYERGWQLASTNSFGVGAPAVGASPAQPVTQEVGVMAYFEACLLIQNQGWTVQFDNVQAVYFAHKDRLWISYDNATTIGITVDWLMVNDFGGAFVWSLDLDDFRGKCQASMVTYPITKTLLKLK